MFTISIENGNNKITPSIRCLGGKGYNLVLLKSLDIKVPDAFIVCENAYRDYCTSFLDDLQVNSIDAVSDEELAMLQSHFEKYKFNQILEQEIQQHLASMTKNSSIPHILLAVRSSGIEEDLDEASFAGMNDTVLNVPATVESVCDAIRTCWKSLFSRRSVEYRKMHGFSLLDTSMAVIVQVMIPSEKSGVCFTADSQTGSRSHLCIDGVFGMGETLVSGLVNTDHWRIRKPFGARKVWYVEDECINKQAFKYVSNYPNEGTTKIELTEEESEKPVFLKEELDKIVKCALLIENYYKKPMDIEFAFYNNECFILQARPVTHLLQIPDEVNPLLYPQANEWGIYINIGYFQMLTDAFTPMGYSTILQITGLPSKYLLYVNGFLYMDLSGFVEGWLFRYLTISKFRSMADEELAQILAEMYKTESKQYSHKEAKAAKSGIFHNFFMPIVKLLIGLYKQKLDPVGLEAKILEIYNEELAIEQSVMNVLKSDAEHLIENVFAIPFDAIRVMALMKGYMQFAFRKYEAVIKMVVKSGLSEGDAEKLWQAPEENIANRYNNMIVRLGREIKKLGFEEKVREFASQREKEAVDEWINEMRQHPSEHPSEHPTKQFLAVWDELMAAFGCRCHCELDVGANRYSDTPYTVLEMALNVSEGEITEEGELIEKRKQALQYIKEKVSASTFKKIEKLLPTASLFMKYREHQKYAFIRILHGYHQAFLTKGSYFVKKGLLEKEGDVFYLTVNELLAFEKGENDGSRFKQQVIAAKEMMKSAGSFTTPRVLCKPEGLMIYLSERTRDQLQSLPDHILKGMPTSPGVVEGRTVVATDPHSTVLQKGDILVAKATDPSWTPLFSTASAVAIEIGGQLTHGSVVAKELGIPCVVAIPGLMTKIQNGMRIRIDGSKGVVEIL